MAQKNSTNKSGITTLFQPSVMALLGLTLMGLGAFTLAGNFVHTPTRPAVRNTTFSYPTSIYVGNRETAIPVTQGDIVSGEWQLSKTEAVHLSSSGYPGNTGNIVVYGHNTSGIFGSLKQLSVGEHILLDTANGSRHVYTVANVFETTPKDTKILDSSDTEQLTLYTCTGFLDSKRLVVKATKVGEIL